MGKTKENATLDDVAAVIALAVQFNKDVSVFYCPTGPAPRIEVAEWGAFPEEKVICDKGMWSDIQACFEAAGYETDPKTKPYSPDYAWVEYDYTYSQRKAPAPRA